MTLARLIEAVEAGRDDSEKWRPALGDHAFDGMTAFHGSLDAAKRLHDALLPDHRMILDFVLMEVTIFRPCHDDAGESTDEWDMVGDEVKAPDGNMARAMLLADLTAYAAILRAVEGREPK